MHIIVLIIISLIGLIAGLFRQLGVNSKERNHKKGEIKELEWYKRHEDFWMPAATCVVRSMDGDLWCVVDGKWKKVEYGTGYSYDSWSGERYAGLVYDGKVVYGINSMSNCENKWMTKYSPELWKKKIDLCLDGVATSLAMEEAWHKYVDETNREPLLHNAYRVERSELVKANEYWSPSQYFDKLIIENADQPYTNVLSRTADEFLKIPYYPMSKTEKEIMWAILLIIVSVIIFIILILFN